MAWFSSGRADAYESNADHLRDELHRIAGFARAQLLRFKAATPEAQRERFWHLPDDEIDALARGDDHSPLAAFDVAGDAGDVRGWVAERRKDIDRRLAATKNVDLRLVRLAREFGLTALERDALLLALLPNIHSTYRRWFGLLQGDAAKTVASTGLIAEMLAGSANDYARLITLLAPGGRLAQHRLLVAGGSGEEPAAVLPLIVEDRVTAYVFGEELVDPRLADVARWFTEPVAVRSLPIAAEVANRLEMLPNLRAAEPEFLRRLRLEFLGPDPGLAVRTFAVVARGIDRGVLVVDVDAALASGVPFALLVDCALREARLGDGVPIFTGVAKLHEQPEHATRAEHLASRLEQFPHPAAIAGGAGGSEEPRPLAGWIPFRLVRRPSPCARRSGRV